MPLHSWQKGDKITAARLQEMRNAILSTLTGGRGINVKAAGGNKVAIESTQDKARTRAEMSRRFYVPFYNNSGAEIPAYSFVLIDGVDADAGYCIGIQPDADSISAARLLVTGPGPVPIAEVGMAYYAQSGGNWVAIKDGGDPAIGGNFGTVADQWCGDTAKKGFKANGVLGGNALIIPFKAAPEIFKFDDWGMAEEQNPTYTRASLAVSSDYGHASLYINPTTDRRLYLHLENPISTGSNLYWMMFFCCPRYLRLAVRANLLDVKANIKLWATPITADFVGANVTWNNKPTLGTPIEFLRNYLNAIGTTDSPVTGALNFLGTMNTNPWTGANNQYQYVGSPIELPAETTIYGFEFFFTNTEAEPTYLRCDFWLHYSSSPSSTDFWKFNSGIMINKALDI